jgi:putative Holliday junction resolvase
MPERQGRDGPQIVLGFDFGLRRIGVASGDTLTGGARALDTIVCGSDGPDWAHIERLLAEWKPALNIVGLPYNADGTESKMAVGARRFALALEGRSGIPVEFVDERYSTLDAQARVKDARATGARKRRVAKADIDASAAREILERWFAIATR